MWKEATFWKVKCFSKKETFLKMDVMFCSVFSKQKQWESSHLALIYVVRSPFFVKPVAWMFAVVIFQTCQLLVFQVLVLRKERSVGQHGTRCLRRLLLRSGRVLIRWFQGQVEALPCASAAELGGCWRTRLDGLIDKVPDDVRFGRLGLRGEVLEGEADSMVSTFRGKIPRMNSKIHVEQTWCRADVVPLLGAIVVWNFGGVVVVTWCHCWVPLHVGVQKKRPEK